MNRVTFALFVISLAWWLILGYLHATGRLYNSEALNLAFMPLFLTFCGFLYWKNRTGAR